MHISSLNLDGILQYLYFFRARIHGKIDTLFTEGGRMIDFHAFGGIAQLFDAAPDIHFWVKDCDGVFQGCNTGFATHFGLSGSKDLEGRTDFDVSPHPLAREYVQDDKTVLASGKPILAKMELVKDRSGALKWYATSKVPLVNRSQRIIGTAGTMRLIKSPLDSIAPSRGMDQALTEINTRYGEDLRIPCLAALAGMSVDNFEDKFRGLFRETPLKYLNRIRMRAACGLLIHADLTVGEIAKHVGFADQSYFAKRFYAHFRIRPLEYRRKFRSRN